MGWLDQLLGKETRYADADMEVVLPGRWRFNRESDHLSFAKENEQVTVAAYHSKAPLDMPTLLSAVLDLVRVRQAAIRQLSGPSARLSEIDTEYLAGGMNVGYTATASEEPIQIYSLTLGRPTRVVSFTYNRHTLLAPEPEFLARSAALRAGLHVRP